MSLIRFATLSLCCMFMACGTAQFHEFDGSLSNVVSVGTSWFPRDEYTKPVTINPSDYSPASRGMGTEMIRDVPIELNFFAEFRLRLAPWFYTGLTSDYLTLSGDSVDACRFYNCRVIRFSVLDWWNPVTAEAVTIKRSPSFGIIAGLMTDSHKHKLMLQYSLTVRQYDITLVTYAGHDCVNCVNTSYIKQSARVSSGAAWRHTITLGCEAARLAVWFEFDGAKQMSAGLGIILLNALFIEKEDMEPRPDVPSGVSDEEKTRPLDCSIVWLSREYNELSRDDQRRHDKECF